MASILTPLQITAAAALLNNQGLKSLPAALTTAETAYTATAVITAWQAAVTFYAAQSFATASTLSSLLSIDYEWHEHKQSFHILL